MVIIIRIIYYHSRIKLYSNCFSHQIATETGETTQLQGHERPLEVVERWPRKEYASLHLQHASHTIYESYEHLKDDQNNENVQNESSPLQSYPDVVSHDSSLGKRIKNLPFVTKSLLVGNNGGWSGNNLDCSDQIHGSHNARNLCPEHMKNQKNIQDNNNKINPKNVQDNNNNCKTKDTHKQLPKNLPNKEMNPEIRGNFRRDSSHQNPRLDATLINIYIIYWYI